MFSLIVSGHVGDRGSIRFDLERARFLEYTRELIQGQLKGLTIDAIECLKSWPCLLMQEGRNDEAAFVCRVVAIEENGRYGIRIATEEVISVPAIINQRLWQLRERLDIDEFEFSRNHWSIKEVDLLQVLASAGFQFEGDELSRLHPLPLPAPSREMLLRAKAVVADWSHTKIDDFLLNAGVQGLDASRTIGSRSDRANAILRFVLANPAAATAERYLFSALFAKQANLPEESSPAPVQNLPGIGLQTPASTPEPGAIQSAGRAPNRVFVVHGRNEEARNRVVNLLTQVGLEPIVLHEQPNMGRHLLTKFIDEAELVTFAVVVMTDDDIGGQRGGSQRPRARQNVILELGYFIAHLSQRRVCAIITPGLETPSDFDGIVYIQMGADNRWENELVRELRAAKMPLTPSA